MRRPKSEAEQTERPAWSTFCPRKLRLALAFLAAPVAASVFSGVALTLLGLFSDLQKPKPIQWADDLWTGLV